MNPRLVRSGLAIPAVGAHAAAMAGTALPGVAPAAALVLLIAGLAVALVAAARRKADRRLVVAAATAFAAVAVLAAITLTGPSRAPATMPVDHVVTAVVRVEGVRALAGADHAGAPSIRTMLTGVLLEARAGGTIVHAAAPVRLFAEGSRAGLAPGTVVRTTVVLRRAPATDSAAFVGSARGGFQPVEPAPPLQAVAQSLRDRFAADAARLPGDGGDLLPGLAIGDDDEVPADLRQAMREASLSHLTAVSGANCAVVVAGALMIGAALRLPRALRLLAAATALAGFVVLVTPQPSVVRAAAMAAVVLLLLARGHPIGGVPVLAVAVIGLLVADPWYAWSAGFVLSVLATAGLLLLTRPIADRLGRILPRGPALVLAVPIAAQLACQPVLILLQPSVPLAGVVANLVAGPAAPVATVLGLAACLLGPVAPPIAAGLALLAWVPSACIALVARGAAALPQVPWPEGVGGALLAAAVVVAVLVAMWRTASRPVRLGAVALLALAGLLAAGATAGRGIAIGLGTPRDWDLAACDVGQGDGIVLNGGGGHIAVVDTGREPQPILDCLERLGVGRIELLVLTHWDADHVGAARALASRTGTALVGPSDGEAADALRRDLAAAGVRVHQVGRGDEVRLGRDRLQVLWPPDPLGATQPGNAASVTLLVTGRLSALTEGDLGEEAQDAVLAAGGLPAVDVVKVSHHGSADQSAAFYRALDARLGVISVGAGNDYGHPTRRLLDLLRSVGTAPVRTDQNGLILVSATDGRLRLWTERPVTDAVWRPAR